MAGRSEAPEVHEGRGPDNDHRVVHVDDLSIDAPPTPIVRAALDTRQLLFLRHVEALAQASVVNPVAAAIDSFAHARIEMPDMDTLEVDSDAGPYVKRGFPGRGALIVVNQSRQERNGRAAWRPTLNWGEGNRTGRVTSAELFLGAYDRRANSKRPCFNARLQYLDSDDFEYSARRFYLDEEGVTWRWKEL